MEVSFEPRSNKWWITKIILFKDGDSTKLFEFAEEIFELKPFIFDKAPAAREKDISRIFRRLSQIVHPDRNSDWVDQATQAMSTLSQYHEMIAKEVAIENMTWDEFKKSDGGEKTGAEEILRRAKETMDEENALEEQFAEEVARLASAGKRVLLKGLTGDHYVWNGVAVEVLDYQKSPLLFRGKLPGREQVVVGYGRITKACFERKGHEADYLDWRGKIDSRVQSENFWDSSSESNTVYAPEVFSVPAHDFSMLDMQKARSACSQGTKDYAEFETVLRSGYFLDLTQQGKDVLASPYRKRMRVRSKHALRRGSSSYWYVALVLLEFPSEEYFIRLAGNITGDNIEPIKQELRLASSKVAALKDEQAKKLLLDADGRVATTPLEKEIEAEEKKASELTRTIGVRGLEIIPTAKKVPRRFPEGAWFRFRERPAWLTQRVWPDSGILRGKVQEYRRFPHLCEDTAFVQLYNEKDERVDGGLPEQIAVSKLEELGGSVEHSIADNERQADKARTARMGLLTAGYPMPQNVSNFRLPTYKPSEEHVKTLMAMGLGATEEHAQKVLKQANGNLEMAANYLMADKNLR